MKFVPRDFYEKMRRGKIQVGDVLIVKDGATTGKVALVTRDFPFHEAVANEHLFVCRPNSVSSEYLFWFLFSDEGQRRMLEHFKGSAQGGINQGFASQTLVPVAPPHMQSAIAKLLSFVQVKRASAHSHMDLARRVTERFRRAVLSAACSGRLTEDWREVHPDGSADDLLGEVSEGREALVGPRAKPPSPIASHDLPSLPLSWRWASVDSLAIRVVDGVHKTPIYRDSGVPFVTVRNLTAGPELSLDGARLISEEDHARFCMRAKPEEGDLLISKDGTIGVTRAVRTDQPFSIFVSVALVKPVFQAMTDYLELAFSSSQVQAQMIGVGSGLPHLVLRDLKADGIPFPPREEQTEIVRRASILLAEADRLAGSIDRASRQLERTRSATLAKAFSGQLLTDANVPE
ncbi:MAG: restriction endonuclease subunit S [Actinomycetota bacterium]